MGTPFSRMVSPSDQHFHGVSRLRAMGEFPKFPAILGTASLILPAFSYAATAAPVLLSAQLANPFRVLDGPIASHATSGIFVAAAKLMSKITTDSAIRTSTTYSAVPGKWIKLATTIAPSTPPTTLAPTTSVTPTTTLPVALTFQHGAHTVAADPAGVIVRYFAKSTNTNVTIASNYLSGGNGWNGLDGANGSINWLTDA